MPWRWDESWEADGALDAVDGLKMPQIPRYLDYHCISFGEFEGLPVPAFEGTSLRRPTVL